MQLAQEYLGNTSPECYNLVENHSHIGPVVVVLSCIPEYIVINDLGEVIKCCEFDKEKAIKVADSANGLSVIELLINDSHIISEAIIYRSSSDSQIDGQMAIEVNC